MSREDFVKRWRNHIAGLALFGVASEAKDGPLARAAKILEIPAEVERILGMMHDSLAPKEEPAALPARPQTNGKTIHREGVTNGSQRHNQR